MTIRLAILILVASLASARADDLGRTFAGSVQLDYLAVPTDPQARENTLDGATVELSLKMTRDFTKTTSATVKVCYACHGFEVANAYVDVRLADELQIRVGRMVPAFGSFPLRHDPANHMTSDKPLPYDMGRMLHKNEWNEGVLPAPWVDNGIEVGGTHFFEDGRIDYAVYAVSGPKGTADSADFDFVESRSPEQYYVDNNSEPVLGGRFAAAIELDDDDTITLGASGMTGHYDPARALGFAIGGADAVLQLGHAFLRAEYLIRVTQFDVGTDPATRFKFGPGPDGTYADYFTKDGFYAEAEIPIGDISVIGRFDGLRRKGNVLAASPLSADASVLRYTAALAWKATSGLHVKTSVELYRFSEFANELALHLGVATAF